MNKPMPEEAKLLMQRAIDMGFRWSEMASEAQLTPWLVNSIAVSVALDAVTNVRELDHFAELALQAVRLRRADLEGVKK